MQLFYTDVFVLPLPEGHRFPMSKYARLRQALLDSAVFAPDDLQLPPPASDAELALAHCPDYVARVAAGALTPAEIRQIGFPWSPEMVERSRRSAGATLAAARAALAGGKVAANLAGGTHHAHYDRGEGFCVFNDAAVTVRTLAAEGAVRRVAVIDADVHQGNGTATILAGDPHAFTFSLHGARNFPFEKAHSALDIELPDGTGDDAYLAALEQGLAATFAAGPYDLVLYLAGADPYAGDRLGRLAVSMDGLAARDRQVLDACRAHGVPVAIAMAGGYARDIADTVAIHTRTLLTARDYAA
ncbi:histone deacetylase family protein [Oryzomicrobium terrae]|uniref:Histone deacetylase family protein n=1 Tax=Oryzomicrobium terrae TaxID=1735038 RepID=A0A5C1E8P3_9RHOO|nr:histone deacetylase [Oryzomicrobium terrae]QEL65253.1 histone deacetylase family protein [Oryzomicrobium terrae]